MNTICDNLITIFSTQFGATFKHYFKGRQDIPAIDDLPMIMVIPVATRIQGSGTVRDKNEFDIKVEVVASLKQYFDNAAGQGEKLDALEALVNWVEARDSDGDLSTSTIAGLIRRNITLPSSGGVNTVLFPDKLNISYETYLQAAKFPYVKATLSFTAYDRANRV